jgi:hypothetical protein
MMIKSQMPIPTATPTIVWSLRTGAGISEVRPSVPPAAFAAEAEALGIPEMVVVLRAMILVTIDAPEPAAELKRVEMGVDAELNNVETGLTDWNPALVDELPDEAVIEAPPDSILVGTLSASVDDDWPTGGWFGLIVGEDSIVIVKVILAVDCCNSDCEGACTVCGCTVCGASVFPGPGPNPSVGRNPGG